jgi:hypothetical protein
MKWVPVRVKKTRQSEKLEPAAAPGAANYKILPSGPIPLPALSEFSTPTALKFITPALRA